MCERVLIKKRIPLFHFGTFRKPRVTSVGGVVEDICRGFEHHVCVISRWCLKVSRELPDSLQKSMFHHWDFTAHWMCFGVSLQQKNALIQPPSVIHRSYTLTSHLAGWGGWGSLTSSAGCRQVSVLYCMCVRRNANSDSQPKCETATCCTLKRAEYDKELRRLSLPERPDADSAV